MLQNDELLNAAETAGFQVFVTAAGSIRYLQNLAGRKIAVVILTKGRWQLFIPKLDEMQPRLTGPLLLLQEVELNAN